MIVINVVNTQPIITGKHDPTMSGKHRPAIDKGYTNFTCFKVLIKGTDSTKPGETRVQN